MKKMILATVAVLALSATSAFAWGGGWTPPATSYTFDYGSGVSVENTGTAQGGYTMTGSQSWKDVGGQGDAYVNTNGNGGAYADAHSAGGTTGFSSSFNMGGFFGAYSHTTEEGSTAGGGVATVGSN